MTMYSFHSNTSPDVKRKYHKHPERHLVDYTIILSCITVSCVYRAQSFSPLLMHSSCFLYPLDFNVPKMDVAFAISATAFQSDANFKKMQDTIKEFIDRFGVQGRVHYALVTFGDPPSIHLQFSDKSASLSTLKGLIEGVPKPSKEAALDKALRTAKMLFKPAAGGRVDAEKILVVMTDRESDSSSEDSMKASKQLEHEGIRVIAVPLGDEDNVNELKPIVPIKEDVIKPNTTDKPRDIADKIIDNMLDGKLMVNAHTFIVGYISLRVLIGLLRDRETTCYICKTISCRQTCLFGMNIHCQSLTEQRCRRFEV